MGYTRRVERFPTVVAALAIVLAVLPVGGCSNPPADGSYARRQTEEIPIERFCACGAWPAEGCPPKNISLAEGACYDSVYVTYPEALWDNALCMHAVRADLDQCFLDGTECTMCRDRWAAAVSRCPPVPLDIRRELDACLTDF